MSLWVADRWHVTADLIEHGSEYVVKIFNFDGDSRFIVDTKKSSFKKLSDRGR